MRELAEPEFWYRPEASAIVRAVRRDTPVLRHDTAQHGEIWSVLSYAESLRVLSDPAFSSRSGCLLGTDPGRAPAGVDRMMALSDPPAHRSLREPVAAFFTVRYLDSLRRGLATLVSGIVDDALARTTVDLVRDVMTPVPLVIVCDLIGVPEADRPEIARTCDAAFADTSEAERRSAHQRLLAYLLGLAMERRAAPRDDLLSALVSGSGGGPTSGLADAVLTCDNIIVGGVQTVRHTASLAVAAILARPGGWSDLVRTRAALPLAIEELFRWTSVSLHILRTATRDLDLHGRRIRAGDRVVAWLPAANRDETVFHRPDVLDLGRRPNRHLALGWGPHYCIGAGLARMELAVLFAELIRRVADVEALAEPVPHLSTVNLGLASFRVRLHPAPPP